MTGEESIGERLVRIETKLDGFLAGQKEQDERSHDHEHRIRKLERWQYVLAALAVLGGGGGGFSAVASVLNMGGN